MNRYARPLRAVHWIMAAIVGAVLLGGRDRPVNLLWRIVRPVSYAAGAAQRQGISSSIRLIL